jgi:hypothetical protein
MRKEGLEPSWISPHAPQTCASANSATSAWISGVIVASGPALVNSRHALDRVLAKSDLGGPRLRRDSVRSPEESQAPEALGPALAASDTQAAARVPAGWSEAQGVDRARTCSRSLRLEER